MTRDKIILVDGSLRGATLAFLLVSLASMLRGPDTLMGLTTWGLSALCIGFSWGLSIVFKDMDLPS